MNWHATPSSDGAPVSPQGILGFATSSSFLVGLHAVMAVMSGGALAAFQAVVYVTTQIRQAV